MSSQLEQYQELVELLELQFEERISETEFGRLGELIRNDSAARRFYLQYIDLHGALCYDTGAPFKTPGLGTDLAVAKSEQTIAMRAEPQPVAVRSQPSRPSRPSKPASNKRAVVAVAASVCCLVLVGALVWKNFNLTDDRVADNNTNDKFATDNLNATNTNDQNAVDPRRDIKPIDIRSPRAIASNSKDKDKTQTPDAVVDNQGTDGVRNLGTDEAIVAFINERLSIGWEQNEVTPSAKSNDAEWIRRVFLDVVGHIPTVQQTSEFLADKSADKRARIVEVLLSDEDYVRYSTTIWTNLLIGRSNSQQVDRGALEKFLREAFALNRGWDEVVADIISAEGSAEENGASNFLLAHLNNQAVPATAITAKLFLGQQLQCTQCHDHPFNDSTQAEFWQFNSFFKQIEVASKRSELNPNKRVALIKNTDTNAPTFYEDRKGVVKAVYPSYNGTQIGPDEKVNRRAELARILTSGDSTQIASAFVNRLWKQYFGAAFTPIVDDMGSHVEVSHPVLLAQLTREFVRSGYDVKRLVRWICQSDGYSLSSRFSEDNPVDNPRIGNTPLFSRVYVKSMNVEQLFDSVLVATQAQSAFGSDWDTVQNRRQEWLQQFVQAWDTDENDEADLFDGTIPQALMMMNGELINLALSSRGTWLTDVALDRTPESAKVEAIALAALSRKPSSQEVAAVRRMIKDRVPRMTPRTAMATSLQDLFWAYLNSNEFILIH
jgi:hypothetical protein